jgi:hypothetical protein
MTRKKRKSEREEKTIPSQWSFILLRVWHHEKRKTGGERE